MNTKKLSIVVPVYCEEDGLGALHARLETIVQSLPTYDWEYIFVNDGSDDNSLEVLRRMSSIDDKVKVIDLSRNFGKEIALSAGVIESANSDGVICIDADLQHPPELIPALIRRWEEGADVVIAIRTQTRNKSFSNANNNKFN